MILKIILILIGIVILVNIYFVFDPSSRRIRKIQSLINKDRTVCDFINMLKDWEITNIEKDALVIMVNPVVMPMYKLYITYKNRRPTNVEIKKLHWELTNENSLVTEAHKNDLPVEYYIKAKNK